MVCLVGVMLTTSCTGRYFRKAIQPPEPQSPVVEWPIREYWTAIVFNGSRIGFTHFRMAPATDQADRFDIRSEAFLRTRFLWMDKTVHLKSFDRVRADLTLEAFRYSYNLDGSQMTIEGQAEKGDLVYTIKTRGQTDSHRTAFQGPVYPSSATGLYPLLRGLNIGNRHQYNVFDGQAQQIAEIEQRVIAYEESELFSGPAFRIVSRFLGQKVTTWMDTGGYPLLEMSMGGVIIAELEDESSARNSLMRAALNKEETLIEFSRIRSDRKISSPDRVRFMQVRISGIRESISIPSDFRQQCRRSENSILCRIEANGIKEGTATDNPDIELYLRPTTAISARHPRIEALAKTILPDSADQRQQIDAIVQWQQANIRREPIDVFTALDVLENGSAECQGHALLFAALARSIGIPTRVANGIVYTAATDGFLYHSWNESYIEERWVAVDPTFGQIPADATHVKLADGHRLTDLAPLLEFIGRVQVQVLAFE